MSVQRLRMHKKTVPETVDPGVGFEFMDLFAFRPILRPVFGGMVFLTPCIYEGVPAAKMQNVDEYLSVWANSG